MVPNTFPFPPFSCRPSSCPLPSPGRLLRKERLQRRRRIGYNFRFRLLHGPVDEVFNLMPRVTPRRENRRAMMNRATTIHLHGCEVLAEIPGKSVPSVLPPTQPSAFSQIEALREESVCPNGNRQVAGVWLNERRQHEF